MNEEQLAKDIFKIVGPVSLSPNRASIIDFMKFYCDSARKNQYLMSTKQQILQLCQKYNIQELNFEIENQENYLLIQFSSDDFNAPHAAFSELSELLQSKQIILSFLEFNDISQFEVKHLDDIFKSFLMEKEKKILSMVDNAEKNELEKLIEKKSDNKPIVKV